MSRLDSSGKRMIHLYARAWAEWLLAREQIEVEAELSSEFQVITRATDVLLQVRSAQEGRFLSLTELQTRYDSNMPRRLAAYAALAREKFQREVFVTVVYLVPPPAAIVLEEAYHEEFLGQLAHQDFQVIRLWELDAQEALARQNPALLPFIPLMRGGATEEMLRRSLQRVRAEPDAEELELIFGSFASLVADVGLVRSLTRWSMHIIQDSPLYREMFRDLQEARAEARLAGHAEGRAEGRAEGLDAALTVLRRFLAYRFQIAEDHFDQALQALDLAAVRRLSDAVIDADSLTAFEQILRQVVETVTAQQDEPSPQSTQQSDRPAE
jgi:predicted transposase YdaD